MSDENFDDFLQSGRQDRFGHQGFTMIMARLVNVS